ncbi:hypothetical protein G6R29_05140 [Fructobacillus sp. M2-14]|uniref:Swt1-like HEPN domain-containing protein n=1 Tax=Fructobacillus broussonetiae TaxID=2713173 RepID=A0ABS5R0N2_9LACO|nr:hypothetical protein [Fructobacillus broussonetiae]MBS9339004.1 hypothetical protein [Fructobacillus broussonetiae]
MRLEYLLVSGKSTFLKKDVFDLLKSRKSPFIYEDDKLKLKNDSQSCEYSVSVLWNGKCRVIRINAPEINDENARQQKQFDITIQDLLKRKFTVVRLEDPISYFYEKKCREILYKYETNLRKLVFLLLGIEENNQLKNAIGKKQQGKINKYIENLSLGNLQKLLFYKRWYYVPENDEYSQLPHSTVSDMSDWILKLDELPKLYSTWELNAVEDRYQLMDSIDIHRIDDIRTKIAHHKAMDINDYTFSRDVITKANLKLIKIHSQIITNQFKYDSTAFARIVDDQMKGLRSLLKDFSNTINGTSQITSSLAKLTVSQRELFKKSAQFSKMATSFKVKFEGENIFSNYQKHLENLNQLPKISNIQSELHDSYTIVLDNIISNNGAPEERSRNYMELLEMNYDAAVLKLRELHGRVPDHLYSKKTYEKFIEGSISSLHKNKKISRLNEGLMIYHVLENQFVNIGKKAEILKQKLPFSVHESNNLIYVDEWEKAILKVLIQKEKIDTEPNLQFMKTITSKIKRWYVQGKNPMDKNGWNYKCYEYAYVDSNLAQNLIKAMTDCIADS